jgi:hypothetical protein
MDSKIDEQLHDKIKPTHFMQWLADKLLSSRFTRKRFVTVTINAYPCLFLLAVN